ncbi:3-hydroxybutyrate oligomer hydrolase family protein [Arenimonas oryziterrae]|uniref:Hydrogenase n=1 Tax=Arenimonas oryziterrae DSM 21050 = YC6267 TaxID=1121015 RepID=A0A091AZI1_9GAMM|nr:3-hydroxybutyrate oligomer hydrolase family protein [Arenimonas oryziterrae]KFN44712.1 hypothetical protein N789_01485 [Arenimonas oryziterrae DSM 21050 = YC6267]
MNPIASRLLFPLAALAALVSVATAPAKAKEMKLVAGIALQSHREGDDLLTAGLGTAGLRSPLPPAFADAAHPTPQELRRRAIWSNWRGIADLAPGGGYGELYGSLAPVPGREYQALVRLPGAKQPHRVMVQLPDAFDAGKRCIVVNASSGSRGIYGGIALAGAWGLSHGCAVAYTDKGTGTGFVDTADGVGTRLDGTRAEPGDAVEFDIAKYTGAGLAPVAVKHAHSGDNPEADWGRHVKQAAEFALGVLQSGFPDGGPYTFANTRVIAVGVSNGGGAVLRAAELDGDWLDGVVAISPNVFPGEGGRPLFDYTTEAAIWMSCALAAPTFDGVAMARPGGQPAPAGIARCAALKAQGRLTGDTPMAQAEQARQILHAQGWTDEALAAGAISTSFDLWRTVAVTYASAYARADAGTMPCGYRFTALGKDGLRSANADKERAAWWSDSSGIPPGAGVTLLDAKAGDTSDALPGLQCLRALWTDKSAPADTVRASVAATRARLPRKNLPVLVMHGVDDGLIPEAFSGAAYARWASARGRDVRYWRVHNAQHFDAFLGLPVLGARYLPMLPYAYRGLDAMWAHVAEGKPLPGDADIATTPRAFVNGVLAPLSADHLGRMP